jgi:hypothetical protein
VRRALVVTVDTEEEGRWSSRYPAHGNTCRNIRWLPRIHRIFTRLGVVPTYLVDFPVASDPEAVEILGTLAEGRASEIGAHLHPWCTPPFASAQVSPSSSYPSQLPTPLFEAKLRVLCDRLHATFGVRPTSYRAGRWGFDHTSVLVLKRLGIRVDSSVMPLWWDPADGGPVFVRAPLHPYRLDPADVCRPGSSEVVEIPASHLVASPVGALIEKGLRWLGPQRGLRWLSERLGLGALRPEQFGLERMRAVADAIAARGLAVFNVTFHSSAAMPGATPYVANERELSRFCGRLDGILEHILCEHGARPMAISDVPAFLGDAVSQSAA